MLPPPLSGSVLHGLCLAATGRPAGLQRQREAPAPPSRAFPASWEEARDPVASETPSRPSPRPTASPDTQPSPREKRRLRRRGRRSTSTAPGGTTPSPLGSYGTPSRPSPRLTVSPETRNRRLRQPEEFPFVTKVRAPSLSGSVSLVGVSGSNWKADGFAAAEVCVIGNWFSPKTMTTSKWLILEELMDDMDPLDWEKCRDIAKKMNVAYQQVVRLNRYRCRKRSLKAAREPKETEKRRRRGRAAPRAARKPKHKRPKRFAKRCPSFLSGIPIVTLCAGQGMRSPEWRASPAATQDGSGAAAGSQM